MLNQAFSLSLLLKCTIISIVYSIHSLFCFCNVSLPVFFVYVVIFWTSTFVLGACEDFSGKSPQPGRSASFAAPDEHEMHFCIFTISPPIAASL